MPLDTLDNVKLALMVSGTDDDAPLTRLLDAAGGYVEAHCGRSFGGGTFTEAHPGGVGLVFLRNYPVGSVTDVRVDAARQFGSETVLAGDNYIVHADRGVIQATAGRFLPPRFGRRPDDWAATVRVTYTTPADAVPAAVREAFAQLVGHWYRLAKTHADLGQVMLTEKIDISGTKGYSWSLPAGYPVPPVVPQLLQPFRVPAV